MLIISLKNGQLGNNLKSYSKIIAFAVHHHINVYILGFDDYYCYFENLAYYPNVKFIAPFKNCFNKKWIKPFWKSYLKIIGSITHLIYTRKKLKQLNDGAIHIINAWKMLEEKLDPSISYDCTKEIFAPKSVIKEKTDFAMNAYKDEYVIVGVHIRRGDYKDYRNGEWYYEDNIYSEKMEEFEKEYHALHPNEKIAFLLCSNEKLNLDYFRSRHYVFQIPQAGIMHDLYGLSQCDYIIGAPSSYSEWAAFYGNTPIFIIGERNRQVKLSEFGIPHY